MKVLAVNASPRVNWNTANLLESALKGAGSVGAQTELIHLYSFDYKGCISCFECKRLGGKSFGKCSVNDGLAPVLRKIEEADALILGSPIYFGNITGEMRSFLERLFFQYLLYDEKGTVLFNGKLKTGFIYTMNVDSEGLASSGYNQLFEGLQRLMVRFFGNCETLVSTDTYQFDDYSKYASSKFDAAAKAKRREEVFPEDLKKAFGLGRRLAQNS